MVVGTTGWYDDFEEVKAKMATIGGAILPATNFSLGVNIYLEINRKLGEYMNHQSQYDVMIEETHHTEKLDAPSGTAITLAEGIIDNSLKSSWTLDGDTEDNNIPITAVRTPDVPGTHTISYDSIVDSIDIKHTAHNRQGFALGAVVASEWLVDKTGVFSMADVLNLG